MFLLFSQCIVTICVGVFSKVCEITLELCCWKRVGMEACWGSMKRLCSTKGAESGAVSPMLFIGAALEHDLFRIKEEN